MCFIMWMALRNMLIVFYDVQQVMFFFLYCVKYYVYKVFIMSELDYVQLFFLRSITWGYHFWNDFFYAIFTDI